jgi:opacity protein-like surface antigen
MKKVLILSVILVLCATGSVFAAAAKAAPARTGGIGLTIDGSLSLATKTYSDSGAGLGFGFGASYDLENAIPLSKGKLLARADFNYFQASQDLGFVSLDSSRIPFFIGARYVLPLKLPVDLFAEGGIELSFDKHQEANPIFFPLVAEVSETNLGVTPGFGVTFPLGNNMSIGADARIHIISTGYTSFMFSFGYSF